MAEPWIRVHANLAAKPVVFRAIEALGVSQPEVVGLLVTFWGAVSQHAPNGAVAQFPDAQLEAWAGWTRKRGKFAAFIRAAHLDAQGRVNEWDDYAGVLEEQRRQSRLRKRKSIGHSQDVHSEFTVNSHGIPGEVREPPHLRDETIRYEREEQLLQQQPSAAEAEAEAGLATLLDSDADRNALTVVVGRATDRLACLVSFTSMLTGNDPATPQPTSAVFGQALRDLAANGQKPSARLFRGYLRDVAAETVRATVPPSGAGAATTSNTSTTGARREHWTDKKAREDREEANRQLIRIRAGNVEQRCGRIDGEAWWVRIQREAKAAGINPILYGYDRMHEPAHPAEVAHV